MMIFNSNTAIPLRQRHSLFAVFMVFAATFSSGFLNPAAAQTAPEVKTMVTNFANQVLYILANNKSASQQKDQFGKIFLRNANMAAISRFTLGKFARRIESSQSERLRELLGNYIVQLFVVKLRGTQSEGLEVISTTENKKNTDYLVKSVIKIRKEAGFSNSPIPVKWRIKRNDEGDLKLHDINIGGFWLAQEQRSTFVDLISRNNGRISSLLDYLLKETQ